MAKVIVRENAGGSASGKRHILAPAAESTLRESGNSFQLSAQANGARLEIADTNGDRISETTIGRFEARTGNDPAMPCPPPRPDSTALWSVTSINASPHG